MLVEDKEPKVHPLAGRMSVAVGVAATNSLRNRGMAIDVAQLPSHLEQLKKGTNF